MTGDAAIGAGASSDLCGTLGVERAEVVALIGALTARGRTVATAESLTAGLLAAVLTEVPGASAVVRGGIVCYATDLKASLVGVDQDLLAAAGPVDPRVAVQLAAGARQRCGADFGVGLTGVAGPDTQGGHTPGTVFVAVSGARGDAWWPLPPVGFPATRGQIRAAAVRFALGVLADTAREP